MEILQIHPTLRCNDSCEWCVYNNSNIELDFEQAKSALIFAKDSGAQILKISGGGEPTIYTYFRELLYFARSLQFEIYLQTNGKLLDEEIRELCDDIRISCGDGKQLPILTVQPNGFSYVVSAWPDWNNLHFVAEMAMQENAYLRITADDTMLPSVPRVEEISAKLQGYFGNKMQSGISEKQRLVKLPSIISFWDVHDYGPGVNPCPCFKSPLYAADGFWYPCCKTHVARGVVRGYNTSMRLGVAYPSVAFNGESCTRCYYANNHNG